MVNDTSQKHPFLAGGAQRKTTRHHLLARIMVECLFHLFCASFLCTPRKTRDDAHEQQSSDPAEQSFEPHKKPHDMT